MAVFSFPENLAIQTKRLRKQAGLSQKSLADLAGVGKTVVYDIEHGKTSVQLDTLLKILSTLNMSLSLNMPINMTENENETR